MKNNFVHLCLLIDESIEMNLYKKQIKLGIKSLIEQQKENYAGIFAMSVYKFNSALHKVFLLKHKHKLRPGIKFKPEDKCYLLDAVKVAIDDVGNKLATFPEDQRPFCNIVVIISKGVDHGSTMFTKRQVNNTIEHQANVYSWKFIYMPIDNLNPETLEINNVKKASLKNLEQNIKDLSNIIYEARIGNSSEKALQNYLSK